MTTTPTLGPEITFSFDIFAGAPLVTALADDTFTIGWEDGTDIFARHFNELGSFTTGNFLSALSTADPKQISAPHIVQQTDGSVIVEYRESAGLPSSDADVRWHRVAADFTPGTYSLATESSPNMEWLRDATATAGGGSAIAYEVATDPGPESQTVLRFVAWRGLPAGGQIFVGPHPGETQWNASVDDIFNGNVVIAYENFRFSDHERDVRLHVFTPSGQEVADGDGSSGPDAGEVHVSGPGRNAAFPDVAVTNGGTPEIDGDGEIVVAWQDNTGIAFRRFTDELAIPLDPPTTITGSWIPGSWGSQPPQIAALNDGGFLIAWSQQFGTESDGSPDFDIALQRFDMNGNPVGDRVFIDNPGDQMVSSLTTLDDGRVVLALSDETGNATDITTLDYRILDPRDSLINGTSESETIVGREDASTINGLAGNDKLIGRDGDDTLNGGPGADYMAGGRGTDTYFVDNASDRVIEGAVPGIDTVKSFVSFSLAGQRSGNPTLPGDTAIKGGVENLTLLKIRDINATGNGLANVITGNSGDNVLNGGAGADNLVGGDGDDLLVGGTGKDTLVGGAGRDRFDFNAPFESVKGVNRDVISDFREGGKDKIDLATIDANTTESGNEAFQFIGAQGFHGVAGELRYASRIVSGDVDGNGVADFQIKLIGSGSAVHASDFVL